MSGSEWRHAHLLDVVDRLEAGVSVNAEDRPAGAGEVGVLKTSSVAGGRFFPTENKTVLRADLARVATPVTGDSVIVSRMNTPDLVGDNGFVPTGFSNLFLPDRLWLLRVRDRDAISIRWLSLVLTSAPARAFMKLNATGTSGSMKNLAQAQLLALPLYVPPLPEQQRIAEILDTLDEAIRKTEEVIAKLERARQGLLHDLLTQGLDENGELRDPERHPEQFRDSELGRIPREWEVTRLGMRVRLQGGFGFPHRFQGNESGELPFLKVSDMSLPGNERWLLSANNYVSRELAARQGWQPAPAGGVAFAKVGAALLLNRRRALTRDALVDNNMMVAVPERGMVETWLYWWLTTVDFGDFVQPGVLPSVNQRQLATLSLALPPESEQAAIADFLDVMHLRATHETESLKALRSLKHGLMDDLLTGRVRVPLTQDTAR